jgi:hypothetical protein
VAVLSVPIRTAFDPPARPFTGVFFSAGQLHLLPDAAEEYADVQREDSDAEGDGNEYPFVYLASCVGFLMVFAIEQMYTPGSGAVPLDHVVAEKPNGVSTEGSLSLLHLLLS